MEEVMKGQGINLGDTLPRDIGLFIFNNHNELLIKKDEPSATKASFRWTNPYAQYPDQTVPLIHTVQEYLKTIGVEGELHEAFILNSSHQPLGGGTIVIVLASSQSAQLPFAHETYQWIPLDKVCRDIHERPLLYAPWFRMALESVALYFKNLLKNRSFRDKVPMHSENV